LRDLVRRCVQKDANRRLRDIGDARIELDEMSTARAVPTGDLGADAALTNRRHTRWGPFVATAAFVMLAVVATTLFTRSNRGVSAPAFRELTFRHGTISGARFATDGQTVVYGATWTGAQPQQLYIIRPASPQSGSIC